MLILKWIIIILAVLNFGFMTFDGSRALIIGDYVRPKTGEHAGQLGPWSKVATAVGIDPEGTLMKTIFLLWGALGLILTTCFAMGVAGVEKYLLILNVCTLWYLVPGTISGIIVAILLYIYMRKTS
ncbi:MAG: hypothetical protein H6551_06525 [Chitinophagales bacterium]|nr:hypothetical protein [Chitinophagaceae bacterium]MCB9064784.1 hypothetical protein [Chitinophagales bacterium]